MAVTWPGLPVLVKLAGRPVILLGEGEAAGAKRRLLERAGATVVADHPDARLAIVAVDNEGEARACVARLRGRGLLVNAVDRPELCDFTLPAVVDRAPVLVAVATGGVSAGLAAALRQRLEALLPASLGRLAEALGAARELLRTRFPDATERRRAIGAALAGPLDPLDPEASERVATTFHPHDTPASSAPSHGAVVTLASADPDDLTLRQARAFALADRVLHAPGVPPAILARARADAPRIALATRPAQVAAGDVWVELGGLSGFGYRINGAKGEKVEIAEALTCHAELVWVHLNVTTEHAQSWLRDEAKLEPYVVDALTATETRPRCEEFHEGALVNLRGRTTEALESTDLLASVRIWAIKGRVFSVTRTHMLATDAVQDVIGRGEVHDPGDLIAAFATAITADLDPVVAELGDSLDDCEEQLSSDRVFELRRGVTRVRTAAIGYRRFLQPQRAALEKLASLPGDWLQDDDRLHLNAAADRAARMAEELESIRERSSVMHDTLSDLRAEQLDTRSLIISIVAMIFLPLTFITGFYGMNVKGLPGADSAHAAEWITFWCVAIAVGVTGFFLRRHWFRG